MAAVDSIRTRAPRDEVVRHPAFFSFQSHPTVAERVKDELNAKLAVKTRGRPAHRPYCKASQYKYRPRITWPARIEDRLSVSSGSTNLLDVSSS